MIKEYTLIDNLVQSIDSIPTESIVSRTIHQNKDFKTIMFAFAPGQELSEHTAPVPAIIQILEGHCKLKVGDDSIDAGPGTWLHMPANTNHAIKAETPLYMLLIMLQKNE
jgi:quercetin dioxygenase-like cupin family protein